MDTALPTEINTQILSYLSQEDVVRFKGLNTNYNRIIIENSGYLKYPTIEIKFQDSTKDKKSVEMWINGKMVHVKDLGNGMVEVEEGRKSRFSPSLREGEQDLRCFFDEMFEKADLSLKMNCIRKLECMPTLIEAIIATPSLIRDVEMNVASDDFDQLCELLVAIGQHKRKAKKFPCAKFTLSIAIDTQMRDRLIRLNEIVAKYASAVLSVMDVNDVAFEFIRQKNKLNFKLVGLWEELPKEITQEEYDDAIWAGFNYSFRNPHENHFRINVHQLDLFDDVQPDD